MPPLDERGTGQNGENVMAEKVGYRQGPSRKDKQGERAVSPDENRCDSRINLFLRVELRSSTQRREKHAY